MVPMPLRTSDVAANGSLLSDEVGLQPGTQRPLFFSIPRAKPQMRLRFKSDRFRQHGRHASLVLESDRKHYV